MKRIFVPTFVCLSLVACTKPTSVTTQQPDATPGPEISGSSDSLANHEPQTDPTPQPPKTPGISVASVHMTGDCPAGSPGSPEAEAKQAKQAKQAKSAKRSADMARRAAPNCFESSLSLTVVTEAEQRIVLKSIRLLHSGQGTAITDLRAKDPQAWNDAGNFGEWTGTVPPSSTVQLMYTLSAPDWSKVDKAIGQPSDGATFVLEIDMEVDGEVKTITSQGFTRTYNDMVVT